LHDDFSKETEFDCLGLDNLQLSYNSINNNLEAASNLNPNESTINFLHVTETPQLVELQSLNINDKNSSESNNQFNDFSLKLNINSSDSHEQKTLNEHVIENEKVSLEESVRNSNSNKEEYRQQDSHISNESAYLVKQLTGLTTAEDSNSEKSSFLTPTTSKEQDEDDKVFKKPLNDQIYFSNYTLLNSAKKSSNENDLISKLSPQTAHYHKNKLKDIKTIGPKKQLISILNEKPKKEKNSNLTGIVASNNMNENTLFPSLFNKSSFNSNNFTSSMNRLLSLKRSRKRSKMGFNAVNPGNIPSSSITSSIQQISSNVNIHPNILEANEEKSGLKMSQQGKKLIKQNKFNLNSSLNAPLLKYTNKKAEKKAEKLKQLKQNKNSNNSDFLSSSIRHTTNFEPLTKKLAVDANPELSLKLILSRIGTKNSSKKDEVDLDIKELSLLDSHSSEDDSTEIFLK